jgi:RNA polymerase sigma-70 factor (ECF subfamily)
VEINKELIEACINGDRKSQSKLYELSFSSMMNVAFRYSINREDALAQVNMCFLKILKSLNSHSNDYPGKSYYAWIQKIMINTIIDDFRKHKREKENLRYSDNAEYLDQLSSEEFNQIEMKIEADELQAMIVRLSDIQRKVFNLFAIDGYSHKEISQALLISVDNSKYHLSQARKQLQEMLKKQIDKQISKQDA